MKKKPVLLMLFGIIAFSLTQSCSSPQSPGEEESSVLDEMVRKPKEKIYKPKEKVEIYLTFVKLLEENGDTTKCIAMFDANGDFDIDSLTTVFIPQKGIQGHIHWITAEESGIQKYDIEIVSQSDSVRISQKDVTYQDGEWILALPEDIPVIRAEDEIIKYNLICITDEGDTLGHDPYIRIPKSE